MERNKCMNHKDFPKFTIDWLVFILISFCVLFLCFVTVREYPFNYEILDYRRIFEAIKISGFLTLFLVIGIILFNDRAKKIIPSLIRYFLFVFYIILLTYSCNHINF